MAALQHYIKIEFIVLRDLRSLMDLQVNDVACQGTIALLAHYNKAQTELYSRKLISEVFKKHSFEVTNSKGEITAKTLSSSAATITRWSDALEKAFCFDDPVETNINRKPAVIRTLSSIKSIPIYLAKKQQATAKNRAGQQGGRPSLSINNQIKSWSEAKGNVLPILMDSPMTRARTEKITTMLFSASPSEGQARSTNHSGVALERVEDVFKSRSVGTIKIIQTRTTRQGVSLCSPEDKGVLHAVLGFTYNAYQTSQIDRQSIDMQGMVELHRNDTVIYIMDLNKLCKEVGRNSASTSDRAVVRNTVERLMFNHWEIQDLDATLDFKKKFMGGMDKTYYQYFEPIGSISSFFDKELSDGSFIGLHEDRYMVFRLGAWFQNQITSGETYLVHDELKSDRSEIAQQMYSFARGYCGSGTKSDTPREFTFHAAWSASFRQMREDNFLTGLLAFAKRQNEKTLSPGLLDKYYPASKCDPFELTDNKVKSRQTIDFKKKSSGIFWYCGYFFKLEINENKSKLLHIKNRTRSKFESYKVPRPILIIWRDIDDLLVGNKSDANRRRQRIKHEIDQAKNEAALRAKLEAQKQAEQGASSPVAHFIKGAFNDIDDLLSDL